jgi:calnexin
MTWAYTSADGLECGGSYMKLLQDNKALHAEEFSNASPYIIMFGPDKCGATNKVLTFPCMANCTA